jgi:uncharacterized protein (TIGR02996 family)
MSDSSTPLDRSIIEALAPTIDSLFDAYGSPSDPDLAALTAAIAKSPRDETLLLVRADRLDELNRPILASFDRTRAYMMRMERELMESIMKSLMVPDHVLRGEPAPSPPNESPK